MLMNQRNSRSAGLLRVALIFALLAANPTATTVLAVEGEALPKREKLAPGVETVIPVARAEVETGEQHDIVEIKAAKTGWDPKEATPKSQTLDERSTNTFFRRGVYHFQFAFKPLRMIRVDVPQANGKMKKKLVWYMVYRVTNFGQHMTPEQLPDEEWAKGGYEIERTDDASKMLAGVGPHRFIPTFTLRSYETQKEYRDQLVPVAKAAIFRKEQPPVDIEHFYNTVEISKNPIPVSTDTEDKSVWGVVTWIDLDSRIDYFSIFVKGLTNAYKWTDPPGAYQAGDPPGTGREFTYKTLKLNFSRHGDEFDQREEEIRLGIDAAAAGPGPQVDYEWVYR